MKPIDSPIEDLCGSCRICIDACPTGAIVDEYVVDANLCISYQTIENRGEIPDYINLDGWIFGCDVCQDVCPFNKNDKVTKDKDFYPKDIFKTPLNPPFGKGGTERSALKWGSSNSPKKNLTKSLLTPLLNAQSLRGGKGIWIS